MTKHQKYVIEKFITSAKWRSDHLRKRPVMDEHAVNSIVAWMNDWAFIFERDFPTALSQIKKT